MPSRSFYGTVVKAKSDKTIKVSVLRVYKDRLYKKIMERCRKYTVHDENNTYKEGDVVLIREHRPISSTKKWVVVSSSN